MEQKPYVYLEYPKCMYDVEGKTMTVDNLEEEEAAVVVGWMDAATYYKYPAPAPAEAPAPAPAPPVLTDTDTEGGN